MTLKEAQEAIQKLRNQGETDETMLATFYQMFIDDVINIDELSDLCQLINYELTDEFRKMSIEDQKTKGWKEVDEEDQKVDSQEEDDGFDEAIDEFADGLINLYKRLGKLKNDKISLEIATRVADEFLCQNPHLNEYKNIEYDEYDDVFVFHNKRKDNSEFMETSFLIMVDKNSGHARYMDFGDFVNEYEWGELQYKKIRRKR